MINNPKTVFLKYSEGCCWRRLIDLKLIEHYFISNGLNVVKDPKDADIICIETCAFVKRTEDIAIKEIEGLVADGYSQRMIVIGCLAGINNGRLRQIYSGIAINTADIEEINNYFPQFTKKLRLAADTNALFCQASLQATKITVRSIIQYMSTYLRPTPKSIGNFLNNIFKVLKSNMGLNRKICYIRIGWGCEEPFCTFCVEYLAVGGKVISKSAEECLQEVKRGLKNGYTHFAVIADNPAAWRGKAGETLPELLRAMLAVDPKVIISNIDGIHPYLFLRDMDRMLEILTTGRVKSIMAPLQSGDDRILSLMNRRYTSAQFLDLAVRAKEAYPDIILITQIIAGFPSETFDDFKRSVDVVVRAGFTNVTVFPYYCNPVTPSARFDGIVSDDEKFRRVEYALQKFGEAGMLSFNLGVEINPKHQKVKALYDRV